MIADKENPSPIPEAAPEEEESLTSSSAPTVLDLRAALKELLADIESDLDSTSPDNEFPQQPA